MVIALPPLDPGSRYSHARLRPRSANGRTGRYRESFPNAGLLRPAGRLRDRVMPGGARGDAVRVPAAQAVVLVEHRRQLVGWAVHPGRRPVGDRLVHDLPRQDVVAPAHAFAHVEEPLEVDDALTHTLELLHGDVPAGDRAHHVHYGWPTTRSTRTNTSARN